MGQLRMGTKSELLNCFTYEPCVDKTQVEAAILDGAVIVNILKPYNCQTFDDFIPYLTKELQDVERLDIVWDMYLADSLKNSAKTKRGQSVRWKISEKGKLPSNWQTFLRCDENKVIFLISTLC